MASGTTPTWARPYPLESDVPDAAADMHAMMLSLDTFPAYPATMVTSATAAAGFSYVVSPSQTLTYPASPIKGDIIRAIASSTVTGATQVVVAASGGKGINGLGLSAASSLKLGTPFAHVTSQYDGTNWQIIDGQQDTGWLTITPASGFTSPTTAQARRRGDRIELRGTLHNNTGGSVTLGTVWGTLPSGLWPSNTVYAVCGNPSTGGPISLYIHGGDGQITSQGTVLTNQSMDLHTLSYPGDA